jgi:hypothetical protein
MSRYSELTINGEDKWEEVQAFGQAIRLDAATSGRHSTLLLIELYLHTVVRRAMNPARVIREIQALEGMGIASKMKPAVQFTRPHLKGLWHQHYLPSGMSAMAHNIRNGLHKDGLPWFEQRIREAQEAGEDRYVSEDDIKFIAHDAVIGNWERRSQASEMTGEWIIYAEHEGAKYYLCLGQHNSGDAALRKNIDATCVQEFPFLSDILVPVDPSNEPS